jgi:hypothetical protein
MKTDWDLIRAVMNAAIDSCERLEKNGYEEKHRGLEVDVGGQQVRVYDFLVSAWTMPEQMRYEIIRARHDQNIDLPYVPETARILTAVAAACAEIVNAGQSEATEKVMQGMMRWYQNHFDVHVERAIKEA